MAHTPTAPSLSHGQGSATMLAMVTMGQGGYEQLQYQPVSMPEPGAGEVLLRVLAAGINATDINTRVGWYAKEPGGQAKEGWNGATPFPLIQGADCCAVVERYGPDVQGACPEVGTRVLVRSCMRTAGFADMQTRWLGTDFAGAFAQYVVVPASEVFAVRCDWSDAELATIPCAYGTAENMLQRADVRSGERVLIAGASGGVGSAAVQLALARGAIVTAITQTDKIDALRQLGVQHVVDRHSVGTPAFAQLADSMDVVVDNVAGPGFTAMLATLRRGGRLVTSGAIAGAEVALDLRSLYLRDIRLLGCTAWSAEVFPRLVALIESGAIRPLLAATYALSDMAQAQAAFLEKKHLGNLVLIP